MIPLVWLLTLPVAIWTVAVGARGGRGDPGTIRTQYLRVAPAVGFLALSVTFAVLALFDETHDPEQFWWLVALLTLVAAIVAGVWFGDRPWHEE